MLEDIELRFFWNFLNLYNSYCLQLDVFTIYFNIFVECVRVETVRFELVLALQ